MGQFHHPVWVTKKILSDQGRKYESGLIANICRITSTKRLRIGLYCLQTNGLCKRYNSTLINMPEILPQEWESNWKSSIVALVPAYNCIHDSSTGFSPYFLVYGRHPWLPIDFKFEINSKSVLTPTSSRYIQELRHHIKWAYKKAKLFHQKEVQWHKQKCDQYSEAVSLKSGDTVLVHVTVFKGWQKYKTGRRIQSMWLSDSPIQTY